MTAITMATSGDEAALCEHLSRHWHENQAELFSAPGELSDLLAFYGGWDVPMSRVGWQRAWLARVDGAVVAHVAITGNASPLCGHRATLGMGVESGHRRKGLGLRLMATAIGWAREQSPLRWLDGVALNGNTPVLELDHRVGFRGVGLVVDAFRVGARSYDQMLLALDLRAPKGV